MSRIVIIEDDIDICNMIGKFLENNKYSIWYALNGIDGIIETLITNAIRYTDREIEIFLDKSDVFTIKNISSMLRQEDMKFLFHKFYTADQSRTKEGSDLGLYIMKELLEKIGDRIETAEYTAPILTIVIRFALYECE